MPLADRTSTRRKPLWLAAGAAAGSLLLYGMLKPRRSRGGLPVMSVADTLAFAADVPLPSIAKGVIIRRRAVVGLAEATNIEKRALRRMRRLREKYGPGPLLLGIPFRDLAVILDPDDVEHVLAETPEPFATASREKKAALRHFEPHGALISHGGDRAERRRFNEQVLESGCPVHSQAERLAQVVREEAGELLSAAKPSGEFGWKDFERSWFRIVRRVVLGDAARADEEFHQLLDQLRSDANWAVFKPRRDALREEFLDRLRGYIRRAEPGSLVALAAQAPKDTRTQPEHQVPQWLFAFDPAGMATIRALALLALHPDSLARARREAAAGEGTEAELPLLRATILESLRLWPTTPLILRETTRPTHWRGAEMPAGTGILIFAPFFHRDESAFEFAHRFKPRVWLDEPEARGWPMVPFSGGPGICPARHLVLMTGSRFLAEVLRGHEVRLAELARFDPAELPATLDPYTLRFELKEGAKPHGAPDRDGAPETTKASLQPARQAEPV